MATLTVLDVTASLNVAVVLAFSATPMAPAAGLLVVMAGAVASAVVKVQVTWSISLRLGSWALSPLPVCAVHPGGAAAGWTVAARGAGSWVVVPARASRRTASP